MQTELNRKPSIVYFSDIVGYTRLMGKDENAAFDLMTENLRIHKEVLVEYKGQIIKELGDGILAVFDSATNALNASLEIQKRCIAANKYQLRIGLQSGEIIFDHGDVFGDAVNVASRIQSVAIPSSILFSDRVFKEIYNDPSFQAIKLGGFELKNVDHTLELYALTNPPLVIPKRSEIIGNIKYQESSPWKIRLGILAIVLLLSALIYSMYWGDATWEKDKSVAVLPFQNLSEEDFDYFPNTLTENLIDQIAKISSLKTISYATMKSFLNPDTPLDSISSVVKVSTILKGSVEKLGSGVRINLQLVDVENNKNIWTESYTREGADIPQFQNEIAKEIARILNARLTAEEASQIGKGETSNPEAYDLLFKAKELYWPYKDSGLLAAADYLKQSIELDPNYALAYTWLAKMYYQMGFNHPDTTWYELSLEMSEKALALEPKLAEGFSARGATYYDLGQITKAKNSIDLATSFNPNFSEAIGNLATIHFVQGDLLKALELQDKSIQLSPKGYLPYQNIGWTYKILANYPEAHRWFNKSLEQSKMPETYELNAFTFIQEGKLDSALAQAEKVKKLTYVDLKVIGYIYFYSGELDSAFQSLEKEMANFDDGTYPKYTPVPIVYSYLLKLQGNTDLANTILKKSIEVKKEAIAQGYEDYYIPLDLATAYAVKNQPDESLQFLQMAYERGWRDYFFTEFNPIFKELRQNPGYVKILSQLQSNLSDVNTILATNSLQRNK